MQTKDQCNKCYNGWLIACSAKPYSDHLPQKTNVTLYLPDPTDGIPDFVANLIRYFVISYGLHISHFIPAMHVSVSNSDSYSILDGIPLDQIRMKLNQTNAATKVRRNQPRFKGKSFFNGLKTLIMGPAKIYAIGRERIGAHHLALAYVNFTDDNWEVFDSMRKHENEDDRTLINRIVMEAINRRAKKPVNDLNSLPEFLSDSYEDRMNG